jgi:hypothetical protein
VPALRLLELTVTTEPAPAQAFAPDGDVKLLTSGVALIVNAAVFVADTLVVQLDPFFIAVMVTVFEPALLSTDVVNVPLLAPMVNVAVAEFNVFAPPTL